MSSQNLPPSLPQNQVAIRGELYRGPLPDPEMLERYKNADPSFPERIVKMAENHNDADVGTKKSISRSNIILPLTGQIFTFLLGIGSLFTCIYLAEKGYTGGGRLKMIVRLITPAHPCSACLMVDSLLRGLFEKISPEFEDVDFRVEVLNHPKEYPSVGGLEVERLPAIIIDGEQVTAGNLLHKRQLIKMIEQRRDDRPRSSVT